MKALRFALIALLTLILVGCSSETPAPITPTVDVPTIAVPTPNIEATVQARVAQELEAQPTATMPDVEATVQAAVSQELTVALATATPTRIPAVPTMTEAEKRLMDLQNYRKNKNKRYDPEDDASFLIPATPTITSLESAVIETPRIAYPPTSIPNLIPTPTTIPTPTMSPPVVLTPTPTMMPTATPILVPTPTIPPTMVATQTPTPTPPKDGWYFGDFIHSWMNDDTVRYMIFYAIYETSISQNFYHFPEYPNTETALQGLDVEKAKQLRAERGIGGTQISFCVMTESGNLSPYVHQFISYINALDTMYYDDTACEIPIITFDNNAESAGPVATPVPTPTVVPTPTPEPLNVSVTSVKAPRVEWYEMNDLSEIPWLSRCVTRLDKLETILSSSFDKNRMCDTDRYGWRANKFKEHELVKVENHSPEIVEVDIQKQAYDSNGYRLDNWFSSPVTVVIHGNSTVYYESGGTYTHEEYQGGISITEPTVTVKQFYHSSFGHLDWDSLEIANGLSNDIFEITDDWMTNKTDKPIKVFRFCNGGWGNHFTDTHFSYTALTIQIGGSLEYYPGFPHTFAGPHTSGILEHKWLAPLTKTTNDKFYQATTTSSNCQLRWSYDGAS